MIACEPAWAIGTGKVAATPEQAREVHALAMVSPNRDAKSGAGRIPSSRPGNHGRGTLT